ncbi:hypothetical protein DH2020_032334 [Rehmannia glutinosa]|uniref:Aspartate/glutamate/uridylate kinase domain-containing protein n=1 Tax=Rehmannia glutinosa TaxID=99300 RepID=A0ABR0VGA5_REHGL
MDQRHELSATTSAAVTLTKPLHCIVKLGGAAVTCKNELETINEENLNIVSSQLREAMIMGPCHGMDWSRRPGSSEIPTVVDDFDDQLESDSKKFIVVHGAGSFGHFQASKSGVHKGGLSRPLVKSGTCISARGGTRPFYIVSLYPSVSFRDNNGSSLGEFAKLRDSSHQELGSELRHFTIFLEVISLAGNFLEGIPSIGLSPFSCGWSTCERNIAVADTLTVVKAIDAGFVPVLHGDAVLDSLQIISIAHTQNLISPDVFGVYDRPPTEPGATLLREIAVCEDGSWSVLKPELEDMSKPVEITVAAHDTTGGMVTKISEAAMIAKLGIDVYIVKAATDHSARALQGLLKENIPDDWLGTVIRLAK